MARYPVSLQKALLRAADFSIAVPPAARPRWCQASTSSGLSNAKPMVEPLPCVAGIPSIGEVTMNIAPLLP